MMVVVIYDIDTRTAAGRKRLNKIAKECLNKGTRVQDSVYECEVNAMQYREMYSCLTGMIDKETDSLRFYLLGNNYSSRIEYAGAQRNSASESFIL